MFGIILCSSISSLIQVRISLSGSYDRVLRRLMGMWFSGCSEFLIGFVYVITKACLHFLGK